MGRTKVKENMAPPEVYVRRSVREVKDRPNYADDEEPEEEEEENQDDAEEDVDMGMVSDDDDDENYLADNDEYMDPDASEASSSSRQTLSKSMPLPKITIKAVKSKAIDSTSDEDDENDGSMFYFISHVCRSTLKHTSAKVKNNSNQNLRVKESDDESVATESVAEDLNDQDEEDDEDMDEEPMDEFDDGVDDTDVANGREMSEDDLDDDDEDDENDDMNDDEEFGMTSRQAISVSASASARRRKRTRRGEVDDEDLFSLPLNGTAKSKSAQEIANEKAQRARKRAILVKKQKDEEKQATIQSLLKVSERTDEEDSLKPRFHTLPDPHIRYVNRGDQVTLSFSVPTPEPDEDDEDDKDEGEDKSVDNDKDTEDDPLNFRAVIAPTPMPVRRCEASNTCENPRKYTTKTNIPVCSLACYRKAIS
eukprot:CFRG5647T1